MYEIEIRLSINTYAHSHLKSSSKFWSYLAIAYELYKHYMRLRWCKFDLKCVDIFNLKLNLDLETNFNANEIQVWLLSIKRRKRELKISDKNVRNQTFSLRAELASPKIQIHLGRLLLLLYACIWYFWILKIICEESKLTILRSHHQNLPQNHIFMVNDLWNEADENRVRKIR